MDPFAVHEEVIQSLATATPGWWIITDGCPIVTDWPSAITLTIFS